MLCVGVDAIAIAAQKLRPHRSVSEVERSEFFDEESFNELDEEELGTKGDWDDDDESTDILMY